MRTLLTATLLAAAVLGMPRAGHAQAIWNPSYPQSWPPGAYQPTERVLPFSERYGFYAGPAWYLGMNGKQAYYLEYLDRVDRAERFGRPIPPPPAALLPPAPRCRAARRVEPLPPPVEEPIELAPAPTPAVETKK